MQLEGSRILYRGNEASVIAARLRERGAVLTAEPDPGVEAAILEADMTGELRLIRAAVGTAPIVVLADGPFDGESADLVIDTGADDTSRPIDAITGLLERRRLAASLEATREQLRQYTYIVSHDLKEPLITVLGFLAQIRREAEAGRVESVIEFSTIAENAARRVGAMLDGLRTLSRLDRAEPVSVEIDLNAVVDEIRLGLAGELVERDICIETDDELPCVRADAGRIRMLLHSLIENAVVHGCRRDGRISIFAKGADEHLMFCVSDDGIGIDTRQRDRVFELFRRLEDSDGAGVGLVIARRIVECYGGRIWIEPGSDCGTTVCFTLPACCAAAPQPL